MLSQLLPSSLLASCLCLILLTAPLLICASPTSDKLKISCDDGPFKTSPTAYAVDCRLLAEKIEALYANPDSPVVFTHKRDLPSNGFELPHLWTAATCTASLTLDLSTAEVARFSDISAAVVAITEKCFSNQSPKKRYGGRTVLGRGRRLGLQIFPTAVIPSHSSQGRNVSDFAPVLHIPPAMR